MRPTPPLKNTRAVGLELLKKAKKIRDIAPYRHLLILGGSYCSTFGPVLSLFQSDTLSTTDTQG
jgi:hypothetical protein